MDRHSDTQRHLIGSIGNTLTKSIEEHNDKHHDWQLATCVAVSFLICLTIIAIGLLISHKCKQVKDTCSLEAELKIETNNSDKDSLVNSRDPILTHLV